MKNEYARARKMERDSEWKRWMSGKKTTRAISGWVHNFRMYWQYARRTKRPPNKTDQWNWITVHEEFKAIPCCSGAEQQPKSAPNRNIFFSAWKIWKQKFCEWKRRGKKRCNFFGGLWFQSPFLSSCWNCCYPVISNHLNAVHLPRAKYRGMRCTVHTNKHRLK